jgi:hypothetical protein
MYGLIHVLLKELVVNELGGIEVSTVYMLSCFHSRCFVVLLFSRHAVSCLVLSSSLYGLVLIYGRYGIKFSPKSVSSLKKMVRFLWLKRNMMMPLPSRL